MSRNQNVRALKTDTDQDEGSKVSWWLVGASLAAGAGAAIWAHMSEKSYEEERNAQLLHCLSPFQRAANLLSEGILDFGDMIEFKRSRYQHWAIYIGSGCVIHLTNSGEIKSNKLEDVDEKDGEGCRVNLLAKKASEYNLRARGSRTEIVTYAKSKLGLNIPYDLHLRNCEHFVTECFYGHSFSCQGGILDNNITCVGGVRTNCNSIINHCPRAGHFHRSRMPSRIISALNDRIIPATLRPSNYAYETTGHYGAAREYHTGRLPQQKFATITGAASGMATKQSPVQYAQVHILETPIQQAYMFEWNPPITSWGQKYSRVVRYHNN